MSDPSEVILAAWARWLAKLEKDGALGDAEKAAHFATFMAGANGAADDIGWAIEARIRNVRWAKG